MVMISMVESKQSPDKCKQIQVIAPLMTEILTMGKDIYPYWIGLMSLSSNKGNTWKFRPQHIYECLNFVCPIETIRRYIYQYWWVVDFYGHPAPKTNTLPRPEGTICIVGEEVANPKPFSHVLTISSHELTTLPTLSSSRKPHWTQAAQATIFTKPPIIWWAKCISWWDATCATLGTCAKKNLSMDITRRIARKQVFQSTTTISYQQTKIPGGLETVVTKQQLCFSH